MCRFSVVVPLLGPMDRFEDTLASILRHRPADTQIIVVHNGSYHDPYQLDCEVKFIRADEDSGLISQLNIGLCYAAGEFTVFVRPGVELDENWEYGFHALQDDNVAAVVPILVSPKRPTRLVSAGVKINGFGTRRLVGSGRRTSQRSIRSLQPIGPTLWLAAYRTAVIKAIAPLDESLDESFLDADIALSLLSLGLKSVLSAEFVGQIEDADWMIDEATIPHGKSAQRTVRRHGGGRSGGLFAAVANDLVASIVSPWRLKHLVQRFTVGKSLEKDKRFAERLKILCNDKPWESKSTDSKSAEYRRAA